MTMNPYAAGAKVYNGGSSAATSGPVDPTGYINRELDKPQTYTPGVAAGALSTLREESPSNSQPMASPQPQTSQAVTNSSPTGQISYTIPVDYDLQLKGIEASSQYQDLLLQLKAQTDEAAMDRAVGQRNLSIQRTDTERKDLNNAAYRGMARSSGYVNQVDRTAQDFNNANNDLEARFYAALNQSTGMQTQGLANLNDTMNAIQREAAARLAEKRANDPNSGAIDKLPGAPTDSTPPPTKPSTPPASKPKPTGSGGNPKPTMPKAPVRKVTTKNTHTLAQVAKNWGMSVSQLKTLNPKLADKKNTAVIKAGTPIRATSKAQAQARKAKTGGK